jgi:hypothetical protein
MRTSQFGGRSALIILVSLYGPAADAARAQVAVVNMTPKSLSGESSQDSEASLAINPSNPSQLVGSAFTPDPLVGPNAPIYISTDGGNTWSLNSIVPSQLQTADITLRFAGSNRLYTGIIPLPLTVTPTGDSLTRLRILRTDDFTGSNLMEILSDRSGVDQPFVTAAASNGKDQVYIGNNSTGKSPRTASVDLSLDAAAAPVDFSSLVIEDRDTGSAGQDGPPIRTALSGDGQMVYGVFYRWTAFDDVTSMVTADVVVVRDDSAGKGHPPFAALKDADGHPGLRVITSTTFPFVTDRGVLAQERAGGDLAIAVDSRDSQTVYLAYSNQPGSAYTLHLIRSQDGGKTWGNDLRTIPNAKNPGLAINSDGKVGFLYQQLISRDGGNRWVTHLERTADGFRTPVVDLILSDTPADTPVTEGEPYLGDYLGLLALDKDFYGVFTANNTPDRNNFPSGVSYQRNADFNAKTLFANDGTTPVPISIDPFFFKVIESAAQARRSEK